MSELAVTDLIQVEPTPVSWFEFWPNWLFYAPVVAQWIALGIRYGDFSLPTASNPGILTGGLCGESKSSILDRAGAAASAWIAPYVCLVTGLDDETRASAALQSAGLSLPIVVKPDIGCNGTGVRLVENRRDLAEVLASFPRKTELMLQQLVPFEGEAGIFFVRYPGEAFGKLTSLTHKRAPILFGDGSSTLRELIMTDPRTRKVPHLYLPRLHARLNEVPAPGAAIRLVFTGNHCKGSIFANGAGDITAALTASVNQIMADLPDFHFGRIDVRYKTISALRRGADFRIIEINGVGSEATHIWDPSTRLRDAYRTQFDHYRQAFEIGAIQREAGVRPSGLIQMMNAWRMQRRLMASYPLND